MAFETVRLGFPQLRLSIAAKLYCVSVLSFAAVGTLATASIYFARSTETAGRHLYQDGFVGVESSSRLNLLLEQHRRIVQSSPAEVERNRLQSARAALAELAEKFEDLLDERADDKSEAGHARALRTAISQLMPELTKRAQTVIFFAENFAQDKALEAAANYARTADNIQDQILAYRAERQKIADSAVAQLYSSSHALIAWALGSTLLALLVLIPLGHIIMRGVLRRLGRITEAMMRLAQYDTTVEVDSRADSDEVGDMARAVAVFKANAVELLDRKVQLERVNLHLDIALNNMMHGLCMFNADARMIVANAAYIRMYKLPPELTAPGTPLSKIIDQRIAHSTIGAAHASKLVSERVAEIMQMGPCTFTHELADHRIVAVSHQPMQDGGWVSMHEDITDRRRAEAQIAHMARHDVLTDLPNRVLLREHLELAITRMRRGENFAVLCLDLDRFKGVNDTLGHPVGDQLLKAVAHRLKQCVGPMDTVSRLGGDEFAIIQAGVVRPELTSTLANRIVELISEPYDLDGNHVVVGTSIGVALAPTDGTDPDQLLKNADMALYLAKADGRGTHRFFEPEMDARLQARRSLELDLRHAITHGEFELAYQPIVSLPSQEIIGFEALLRWSHPQRGSISPAEFIPLAEETGLIVPLGEWVLRTACAEAAHWPNDLRLAVNLSAVQFKKRNLVQVVIGALAQSAIPARRLELEITESVLLQDDEMTLAMLHQLRSLGMCISMDDFGTGYSSLSYLRRFPFDKIKIDQSFIRDLAKRHDSTAIVRAVASLAHSLKIAAVAEGVETADQLEQAQAEGCSQAQGYFFGPPMPAAKIPETLLRHAARITNAA
jgi:diguanylate cyclase (GGDEF)-like protein